MGTPRIYKSLTLTFLLIIVIISFLYLLRPFYDADFFWHLKTGEWIWQNGQLPTEDPFSYTMQGHQSSREYFILTSYWLSQMIYHIFYYAGEMQGLVILRFITAGILLFTIFKLKEGDSILYLGLLMIFSFLFFEGYPIERPQVFSFLFFGLLLILLRKIRHGTQPSSKRAVYFMLPLVMLVWANMHAGFLVGQVTIILYIVIDGIKFISPYLKPIKKEAYKRLLITGVSAIVLSLANPNTYHVLSELISQPHTLTLYNTEYYSTVQTFRIYNDYSMILYWFIVFLTIAGFIIHIKEIDITELVLLACLGFVSFTTVRYVPFFMIASLPVVGRYFSEGRLLKLSRVLVCIISIFTGMFFVWDERMNLNNITSSKWVDSNSFPADAAEFIIANDLKGNMYNHFNWGGYLIWKLAPERKVFTDGRGLSEYIFMESRLIDSAYTKGFSIPPVWKSKLKAYSVNYIIIPFIQPDGTVLPLLNALLDDSDWLPVFFKFNSVIFVKNASENHHVIMNYSFPKDQFFYDLIETCNKLIADNPKDIRPYIAKGDLYIDRFRFKEAKEAYEKVIHIAPFNSTAREKMKLFE